MPEASPSDYEIYMSEKERKQRAEAINRLGKAAGREGDIEPVSGSNKPKDETLQDAA